MEARRSVFGAFFGRMGSDMFLVEGITNLVLAQAVGLG
jgi:hypothetical protein